jgi:23S rRNA U2552 (ribose-2'-O)-methylase RlmE/FtsJ
MNSYSVSDTLNIIDDKSVKLRMVNRVYYNETLRSYIHKLKTEIDFYIIEWEKNKRYLNPYEFVNTPFDTFTPSVCLYKPISRAFFKLTEILNTFPFHFPKNMTSFHLAEGPGGFIEAIQNLRKNKEDIYYGMTLLNDDKDVPIWNKCEKYLMKNSENIILETGDGTGNLFHLENLLYVKNKFSEKMDFITGDGGFDFSVDFNNQEENSINLIFAEICFAIVMQKKGGSFVLKVFDTFSSTTNELIYLLTYLYEDVIITKPVMSRPANSEKYIVCLKFKKVHNLSAIIDNLISIFPSIKETPILSFLDLEMSNIFISKMKEINSIFGQSQLTNILATLTYISDENKFEKIEQIKRSHINKCIKWCKKNNMLINDKYY